MPILKLDLLEKRMLCYDLFNQAGVPNGCGYTTVKPKIICFLSMAKGKIFGFTVDLWLHILTFNLMHIANDFISASEERLSLDGKF